MGKFIEPIPINLKRRIHDLLVLSKPGWYSCMMTSDKMEIPAKKYAVAKNYTKLKVSNPWRIQTSKANLHIRANIPEKVNLNSKLGLQQINKERSQGYGGGIGKPLMKRPVFRKSQNKRPLLQCGG